ncbi:NAD(P)-binding oxidoreductase [Catenulispora subtropica]|uniref:NAD(P)H-binding protein n=1 Tax=Catenulispora subtropica TaxID=450798 RepID=A0ABP5DU22_9ACTN
MRIAVLGASGKVGGLLVGQAAERGHHVVALVRDPDRFPGRPGFGQVEVRQADVTSPHTFPALGDVDAVVSAIGISKGDGPGALVAAAEVLAASGVRTVWLGALGSGASVGAGGRLYQVIMRMAVGRELAEKAEADRIALQAGATVVHAPDLGGGPVASGRRMVPLAEYRRPLLPPRISRATVAALMVDEAETGGHASAIVVPLS